MRWGIRPIKLKCPFTPVKLAHVEKDKKRVLVGIWAEIRTSSTADDRTSSNADDRTSSTADEHVNWFSIF